MSDIERERLLAAFDSGWVAPAGPDLAAFEEELAAYLGVGHAVALASGSAGLHLALRYVGVGPGDDVIVPSLTFVATANAVVYTGARPRFVDSETASWNLDPELLDAELRAAPARAVVVVDLYGQCADHDAIRAVCSLHGVPVVVDAAEALGASYKGEPAGRQSPLSVLSFNGNKIITTGGGGMLVTDDEGVARRIRHWATQAREPVRHYEHLEVGYNYRLSNLLAAIGRGQLARLPELLARRAAIHQRYREALDGIDGIEFMPVATYGTPNHWLTVVMVDPGRFGADRDQIIEALDADDIEARPTWKPMHLQPLYAGHPMRSTGVADRVWQRGLCLPSGSSMSEADQDRVIAVLRSRHGARA